MKTAEAMLTAEQRERLDAHCERLHVWEPSTREAIAVAMLTRVEVERAICAAIKAARDDDSD